MTKQTMITELDEIADVIVGARAKCHEFVQTAGTSEREAACDVAYGLFDKVDLARIRLRNRLTCSAAILKALGDEPTLSVEEEYGELAENIRQADLRLAGILAD